MSEEKTSLNEESPLLEPEEDQVEVVESDVSKAVDSLVDKNFDESPIETDGDPFWTIQKLFWGIIKSVVILGGILLLLWFIWRPDTALFEQIEKQQEEEKVVETVPEKPKEIDVDKPNWFSKLFSKDDTNINVIDKPELEPAPNVVAETAGPPDEIITTTSNNATDLAYELEEQRKTHNGSTIGSSIEWLKRAKNIGEISLEVVRIKQPGQRAIRIEEVLRTADVLFSDSITLQQILIAERDQLLVQGQTQNEKTSELDVSLKGQISDLEPAAIEPLLNQKIESQQLAIFYMGQAKLRDTLLRNVQTFDQILRQKSIPLLSPATEIRAR